MKRLDLLTKIIDVLAKIKNENLSDAQVTDLMSKELTPKAG